MNLKRVGLTMRVVQNPNYPEPRDALAQDWIHLAARILPDVQWLPIPNLGAGAVEFARNWQLEGFILTGGETPGETPERDSTEHGLIDYALSRGLPIFGVCRGLQIIQQHFGGPLRACPEDSHVGKRHTVTLTSNGQTSHQREVNSFHRNGIRNEELAKPLQAFASTPDGWVEGLLHREASIAAVLWHPERDPVPHPEDCQLIRQTLGLDPDPECHRVGTVSDAPLLTPFSFPPCVP